MVATTIAVILIVGFGFAVKPIAAKLGWQKGDVKVTALAAGFLIVGLAGATVLGAGAAYVAVLVGGALAYRFSGYIRRYLELVLPEKATEPEPVKVDQA